MQVQLPKGLRIADNQMGLLRGMYRESRADTGTIGAGRCQLIKGDYFYFTIMCKPNGKQPKAGDLLYTFMDKSPVYRAHCIPLACQFIGLLDVYGKALYDRYAVFSQWTKSDEETLLNAIVSDVHFTGDYFLKENPAMNAPIKSGAYSGKLLLNAMMACTQQDVSDFLEYMIARPVLYAGHEWKVSEIFATWLTEGAPTVVKK